MAIETVEINAVTIAADSSRKRCKFRGRFNAAGNALCGIELESPDGLTTTELAPNNAGDLLWGGVPLARIVTGTYAGDGTVDRPIDGVGGKPRVLWIEKELTADGNATVFMTWDTINDDHADGMAIMYQDTGSAETIAGRNNRIVSLDGDGFTVDDDASDLSPNKSGENYNWWALIGAP